MKFLRNHQKALDNRIQEACKHQIMNATRKPPVSLWNEHVLNT